MLLGLRGVFGMLKIRLGRRDVLRLGTAGFLGGCMTERSRASLVEAKAPAQSVIVVFLGGGLSVHFWHQQVHQDHIKHPLRHACQGFFAIAGHNRLCATHALQHAAGAATLVFFTCTMAACYA